MRVVSFANLHPAPFAPPEIPSCAVTRSGSRESYPNLERFLVTTFFCMLRLIVSFASERAMLLVLIYVLPIHYLAIRGDGRHRQMVTHPLSSH